MNRQALLAVVIILVGLPLTLLSLREFKDDESLHLDVLNRSVSVTEKQGRRVFSWGIWAAAATIEHIRAALEAERSTESYAKRKVADAKRREKVQSDTSRTFTGPW